MIVTAKEFFSITEDRDYATIFMLLLFCLSLSGIYMNIFGARDAGLLLLATFLARFFFIYRNERLFDSLSSELTRRMDTERAKPGFTAGNLSLILEKEYSSVSRGVKMQCLKKYVNEMEIELSPDGNYVFYPSRVYNQPGKDRRRRKF
jgi:hypothetical protein